MTKYPFFKKIIHSFYNKDVYIHVGKFEPNKIGFKYLLLLLCIFWIPEIVQIHFKIVNFINYELPSVVERLPEIKIQNGVATFDKPSPYIVKDDETGKDLFIFDDSGTYTSLENTDAQILITGTKVIAVKDRYETKEYSLSQVNDFTLTHEKILSWATWGNFISILLYIFIIPCVFIYRALQILFYSLIGLIFQAIIGTKYSFQIIYRLTILAITPAFIIDKLLGYFNLDFTGMTFLCMVISLSYLFFGMKANKENIAQDLFSAELGANNGGSDSSI
jgi:hypothetical protein